MAIPLPPALVAGYVALQQELRGLPRVKWVEPENLHLTLKFLGMVDRESLPLISSALARAGAASAPAALEPSRVTAFPEERAARVLAVELLDASGAVLNLQRAIERELAGVGVPAEERPFRTHLTLGRVKQGGVDSRAMLARVSPPPARWGVQHFELLESRLGASGPTYTTLCSFVLGRSDEDG